MNEFTRSFIAIELSDEIHARLNEFGKRFDLKQIPGVRPVRIENIHLTLKFLGDATKSQLDGVKKILDPVCMKVTPFSLTTAGIGVFPGWQRPRVLWVGVTAPELLNLLVKQIDQATIPIGFPSEGRKFSPHLTLARFSSPSIHPLAAALLTKIRSLSPQPEFGSMEVKAITFFSSILQKTGAEYSVLSRHALFGSSQP